MLRSLTVLTALTVLAIATPAAAGDILLFKNGTHLAVDSHEVVDDMIYVAIDDGEMAFPAEMVERIERGDGSTRAASSAPSGNRMVAGVERSSGVRQADARRRSPDSDLDPALAGAIEEDDSGTKAYRPLAHAAGPNRRGLAVTGSQRVIGAPNPDRASESDLLGAVRVGDRHVIGGLGPRRRPGEQPPPVVVGLEMRDGGPLEATPRAGTLAPPEPSAPDGGSSDGGSGGSRTDGPD